MGLLSRAFDFLTVSQAPPQRSLVPPNDRGDAIPLALRGAYDAERVLEPFRARAASWADVEADVLIDTARKVGVVFACISLLADAVAEAALRVYRETDGERTEDPTHRARAVIANPNPGMSEAEFWSLLVMQMALQGYAVIEKVRSAAGLPVQLWPLRGDWLVKRPTVDGGSQWVYRVPSLRERPIPADDLVIVPYRHDDRQERLGVSPIISIAREIGIDTALTNFLKAFLDTGGIPAFVLESPDPITDEVEVQVIQERWQAKYGGSKAFGRLPILHGGWKLQQIGGDLDSMAWPDLRGISETKIAQAFRVPGELVQTRDAMKSGGLETTRWMGAMRFLQLYGATPLRNRIDGALTRGFLHDFTGADPALSLEFDTSDVLGLQEDRDSLHNRARSDLQAGGITLNEFRGRIGEPDLGPAGEVLYLPFSVVTVPVSDVLDVTPRAVGAGKADRSVNGSPAKAGRRYRDVKALSPAELEFRARVANRSRRDQRTLAEAGSRHLRRFWKAQGERITAALGVRGAGGPTVKDVADAVDWPTEERKLVELLSRYHVEIGQRAFGTAGDTLGVGIDWDLANPRIRSLIGRLGAGIVDIAEGTRQDVERIVLDALTEGTTVPDLAARLTDLFEQTYRGRAETVARTESQIGYNLASATAYKETGLVEEAELYDNPDHTEDYGASDGLTCAERDGLIVPLDDVPKHVDGEHPNGSLAVGPVLSAPLGVP